ncbi:MAG: SDR family NAD(P)-dependent oxidoreductase, partial [Actinomycetota bacterium]
MSSKVSRTHTPVAPADANVMDLFRMDGMVAVVTGAGRGIGRGIALAFADAGATVVLTARREHELDEVAERIAQRGQKSMKVV